MYKYWVIAQEGSNGLNNRETGYLFLNESYPLFRIHVCRKSKSEVRVFSF